MALNLTNAELSRKRMGDHNSLSLMIAPGAGSKVTRKEKIKRFRAMKTETLS